MSDEKEVTVTVSFELPLNYVNYEGSKKQAISSFKSALKTFLNNEFEDGLNAYIQGWNEDAGLSGYVSSSEDVKKLKASEVK
jgi:hypothetical protein